MDRYWTLAAALGVVAVLALAWTWNSIFPKPRQFRHEGETYIWVPDEKVPLFDRWYKFGSFEYGDGTPVTDLTTVRVLNDAWLEMWSRSEAEVE